MRKKIIIIVSLLFIATGLLAQEGLRIMESLAMHSRMLNQDVKYSVILPEDYYSGEKSYPVVYLLHGLGDDETAWLEFGRVSQFYDDAIKNGSIAPMIFIMPQGYRTYYVNDYQGTFRYQDMFVKELVPFIDSVYRTVRDSRHRGLIGYSMGGFGALVLHLQHPDIFGSTVPLSISIRTDEQYMKEYAPEWNEQWGRLFGAVGIEGPGRITEYYKANNPFYLVQKIPSSEYNKFRIYIDNGDKEQTLCRSNEELHIVMRNVGFPHEFRVRNGGHSFEYWCSAMPNALHFLDDAFEGKPYRGDINSRATDKISPENLLHPITKTIGNGQVIAFLPEEFNKTNRLYPVLYLTDFNTDQVNTIVKEVNKLVNVNEIGPMVIIAVPEKTVIDLSLIMPQLEDEFRIRKDYHFRSVMANRGSAEKACELAMNQVQFSSCVLIDGYLQKDKIIKMIEGMPEGALKKTPFFIQYTDKGDYFEGNGNMHMMFRDKEIKHEYRVGGSGDWGIGGLEEIILFISENFHR